MNSESRSLRNRLSEMDDQQQLYLFERLTNAKAFDVLAEAGVFDDVTPSREEGGSVVHPSWPPTAYLRNVVDVIPAKVATIAAGLSTDNGRVLYDFVDLVAKMPAEQQEPLVDNILQWLDKPHFEWVWSLYVDIALRLVASDRVAAGVRILRRVLRLTPRDGWHIPELKYRRHDAVAEMGDVRLRSRSRAYDNRVRWTSFEPSYWPAL